MEKYNFGNFELEVDKNKTSAWYNDKKYNENNDCQCGYCRNFREVVKNNMLPDEMTEILCVLGIPPEHISDVCMIYIENGRLNYQVCYRVAGNIISNNKIEKNIIDFIECDESFHPCPIDFPKPHFDISFWIDLPWVLNEKLE